MKKIAFCFLIYSTIRHEELWNIFFKNIDTNKYNIYIHYKYFNKPLKYFEKNKLNINDCIETKYMDITLVKAQNILLQKAIADNDNTHFIFVSGSCIPLKCFDYVYDNLNEEYSYFNMMIQSQCLPRCNNPLKFINKKYIKKASQWCILNKKHAELMLNTTDYISCFNFNYHSTYTAPDEHCYITNIFYHHLENEIITTENLASGATTFVNWLGMDYKYQSNMEVFRLKNYTYITKDEILYLLNSKSLFGRKFNRECIQPLNNKKYIDFITSK